MVLSALFVKQDPKTTEELFGISYLYQINFTLQEETVFCVDNLTLRKRLS